MEVVQTAFPILVSTGPYVVDFMARDIYDLFLSNGVELHIFVVRVFHDLDVNPDLREIRIG